MDRVIFILPDANGKENPYGKEVTHPCDPDDLVSSLFVVIGTRQGKSNIRLSLARNEGDKQALAAINPGSRQTIRQEGLVGAKILVGY